MGRVNDQSIQFMQNRNLLLSNEKDIQVFLFTKSKEENIYECVGRVRLVASPYQQQQLDEHDQMRDVWIFPLLVINEERPIINWLKEFTRDELVNQGIIDKIHFDLNIYSVDPLLELMRRKRIDCLSAPGGWFLTESKYFYNPRSKSEVKIGNLSILNDKGIKGNKVVFQNQNKFINPYYKSGNTEYSSDPYILQSDFNSFRVIELLYNEGNELVEEVELLENLPKPLKFQFSREINQRTDINKPFITLVIGANGNGKSTVLSIVQKIFLEVYLFSTSKKRDYSVLKINYSLSYAFGNAIFRIEKNGNVFSFFRKMNNKMEQIHFSDLALPKKILATAFSINDRFTFSKTDDDLTQYYTYLGIKSSDNQATIGETSKNLVKNLLLSSLKSDFLPNMKYITGFVHLLPSIKITFKSSILIEEINEDLLNSYQQRHKKSIKNNKNPIFENQEILGFIKKIRGETDNDKDINLFTNYHEVIKENNNEISVIFDLSFHERYQEFYDDFHIIWYLYEMNIFENPVVWITKQKTQDYKYFKLEEASSGESQFLSTMINILSNIDESSLILIDEPETSFHPNWQNKYVYGLKEIFQKYPSCHFLMATHSPFMVSDLENDSSTIVSFKRNIETQDVISTLHEEETYGWSVEDVLLNIFGLATDRNYYLADELDKILLSISLGDISTQTKTKMEKLVEISKTLKDIDPLKEVITLISSKLEEGYNNVHID
ncbi:AAA family ATPase [Paenibacillus ihuae]|uniref:AAA family ATPase n=1 Tax=Paenibacillus ihuae TaxID=1232431 RepID=UPI0009E871EA|nr:AAA family ATPase [Paenibacillus ihuae]